MAQTSSDFDIINNLNSGNPQDVFCTPRMDRLLSALRPPCNSHVDVAVDEEMKKAALLTFVTAHMSERTL